MMKLIDSLISPWDLRVSLCTELGPFCDYGGHWLMLCVLHIQQSLLRIMYWHASQARWSWSKNMDCAYHMFCIEQNTTLETSFGRQHDWENDTKYMVERIHLTTTHVYYELCWAVAWKRYLLLDRLAECKNVWRVAAMKRYSRKYGGQPCPNKLAKE